MSTNLSAYRVPPLQEFKAAAEYDRAGMSCRMLTEEVTRQRRGGKPYKRRVPMLPGYMIAESKPSDARYVRKEVGRVREAELIRMQTTADRGHMAEPFNEGDQVQLKYQFGLGDFVEMVGRLVKKRGRRQWLVDIGGKQICAQTTSLIRIDPG